MSLINAILGDTYEEVITVIDEKCLKEQNFTNLRNIATWSIGETGYLKNFAWIDYISQ